MELKERWKTDFFLKTTVWQLGTTTVGALVLMVFVIAAAPSILYDLGGFFGRGIVVAIFSAVVSMIINFRYNTAVQSFANHVVKGTEVPPEKWPYIERAPYVIPFSLMIQTIALWSFNTVVIGAWLYADDLVGAAEAWRVGVSGFLFSPIQAFILFILTRRSMLLMVTALDRIGHSPTAGAARSRLGLRGKLIWSYLCLAVLPMIAGVMVNQVQRERASSQRSLEGVCKALTVIQAKGPAESDRGSAAAWDQALKDVWFEVELPVDTQFQVATFSGDKILAGKLETGEGKYWRRAMLEKTEDARCITLPIPRERRFVVARYFEHPGLWISATTNPFPPSESFIRSYGITILLAAFVMGLGVLMGYLSADDVSRSVGAVALAARRAASGEYEPVKGHMLDDEISELALGFNALVESINRELKRSSGLIENLRQAIQDLGIHSDELSGLSHRQREVMDEQKPLVQQATGGTEQISRVAEDIKDRAHHTRGQMLEVSERSQLADGLILALMDTMDAIGQGAQVLSHEIEALEINYRRLEEVVVLIEDIADRTEMLALNAALEAVGESGERTRFSVVAGEVQRLSERISEQTGSIREMVLQIRNSGQEMSEAVRGSRARAEAGPDQVSKLKEAFDHIRRRAENASTSMEEVANLTDEQTQSLDVMKLMIGEMRSISEILDQLSMGAESSAQSLTDMSEKLKGLSQSSN